jgi:hypothetical protein
MFNALKSSLQEVYLSALLINCIHIIMNISESVKTVMRKMNT